MDLLLRSKFCSFCLRNISERRQVRGNICLKHSGSSVSVVIGYIMGHDLPIAALCFRCYKLILGIDYHQHEFKRLKDLLIKLYKERCVTVEKVKSSDFNKTLIEYSASLAADGSAADARALFSACADFASTTSHLSMDQDGLDRYFMCETDAVVPPETLISPAKTGNVVPKMIKDDVNKDIKTSDVTISKFEESGKLTSRSSDRRRKSKKLNDFEYYTDSAKDLRNPEARNTTENTQHLGNFNTVELSETDILCSICQKEFAFKRELSQHACMQSQKKDVIYICKGCQMQFPVRQHYIKHIQSCYKNVPIKCHLCSVELKSAAYLPKHLEAFHNKSTVMHKGSLCDLCGRTFSRKESLQRHQAKVHKISHGIYQCSKCGQTFHHISFLTEHMRAHRGYPCSECKKTFTCMSNLKLHSRTVHQNKELYSCTQCNKRWRFHASYTHHMRKVHGTAQFKCPKCRLLFSAENAFERHKTACEVPPKMTNEIIKGNRQNGTEPQPPFSTQKQRELETNPKSSVEKSSFSTNVDTHLMSKSQGSLKFSNEVPSPKEGVRIQAKYRPNTRSRSGKSRSKVYEDHIMEGSPDEIETYHSVSPVSKVDEDVALMSSNTLEENQLIGQDSNISTSEIVIETLDDLSGDCQYVILVEDGSTDQG